MSKYFKSNPTYRVKEIFDRIDSTGTGFVTFDEFMTIIQRYLKKMSELEIHFLAKRYCSVAEDRISYEKLFEELDFID